MNKADNDNDNYDNYDACPHVHRSEFMDVLYDYAQFQITRL